MKTLNRIFVIATVWSVVFVGSSCMTKDNRDGIRDEPADFERQTENPNPNDPRSDEMMPDTGRTGTDRDRNAAGRRSDTVSAPRP